MRPYTNDDYPIIVRAVEKAVAEELSFVSTAIEALKSNDIEVPDNIDKLAWAASEMIIYG